MKFKLPKYEFSSDIVFKKMMNRNKCFYRRKFTSLIV